MSTTTTAPTAKAGPTASRRVRLAVWVLFLLVLAPGMGVMSNQMQAVTFDERPAAAAATVGETAQGGGSALRNCDEPRCRANYNESPHEVLPAYRWRSDLELYSYNPGTFNFGGGMRESMTMFANIGFSISNLIWTITLLLIQFATTIDYLGAVGARINQGFAALSESLIGIIGIIWLVVMLRAGKLAFKGDLPGMFRSMALFVLPIAFLFYFHTQAAADSPVTNDFSEVGTDAGRAGNVQGSPVWMAQEVTEKMNLAVDGATGGITLFGSATADVMKFPDGDRSWPHCDAYLDKLYAEYDRVASDNGNAAATSTALEQVSKFWAVTVYAPWMDAQFGDRFQRGKVACQYLEERAGTPAAERIMILNSLDGAPGSGPSASTLENGHGETVALEKAGHHSGLSDKVKRDRWLAFAACAYDGDWKVNWRWHAVGEPAIGEQDGMSESEMREFADGDAKWRNSKWCSTWWNEGYSIPDPDDEEEPFKTPDIEGYGNLRVALGEVDDIGHATSLYGVDSPAAAGFMRDFYGHNGTTRIMLGLIAAISAAVYLFVLGGVAFGALLAQFGLVILLIFLPISLIGLAAGADFGRRMIKLTIALCGSKLMFALLLSIMTQLTLLGLVLFSKVGGDVAAGGTVAGGLMNSVATALVPLLVLFLVNRAMSSMGMAKLTSATGALSAIGKLSNQASGKGGVGSFLSNKAQGGGKITGALRSKAGELGGKAGGAVVGKTPGLKHLRHRAERKDVKRAEAAYDHWKNSKEYKALQAQAQEKDALGNPTDAAADAKKMIGEREKSFGKEIGSKQARLSRLEALDDHRFKKMFGLGAAGAFTRNAAALASSHRRTDRGDDTLDADHFVDGLNPAPFGVLTDGDAMDAVAGDQARAIARATHAGHSGTVAAAAEVASVIGAAEAAMIGTTAELNGAQLDAVINGAAAQLKVDPSALIATSGGLVVPDVVNLDVDARARIANTEWAGALALPDEVISEREIADGVKELAEDRARRIAGALASVGALTVDSAAGKIQIAAPELVLEGSGVDLGTAAGASLWNDFTAGVESAVASMPRIAIPAAGSGAALMWDVAVNQPGPDARAILDEVETVRRRTEAEIDDVINSVHASYASTSSIADRIDALAPDFAAGGLAGGQAALNLAELQQEAANELAALVRDSVTLGTRAFTDGEVDLTALHNSIVSTIEAETQRLAVHTRPNDLAAALRKATDDYMQAAETAGAHAVETMAQVAYELEVAEQGAARFGGLKSKVLARLPRDPRGGI